MEYKEAKNKFISTWGSLGTLWGINKAMAQIQALLFYFYKTAVYGRYYGRSKNLSW